MRSRNTTTRRAGILARLRDGQAGAELIEFAMVMPILLMTVLGIIDFSFLFHRQEVVTNAAREGARVAALPGYGATDVENRVVSFISTAGVPTSAGNPTVSVNPTTITHTSGTWPATTVSVSYTHDYMFIGGVASWFGGAFTNVNVNAVSTMRNELSGP